MDHNLPPSRPITQPHLSPRRELQLQGPRPSPLRISKDSHKIMKPPQPRQPVIIYTISPKVIHVEPSNFMDLVQRLTGPNRAAAEQPMAFSAANADVLDQLERPPLTIPGILSPAPASLPPISSAFSSPSTLDPSFQSFLHYMSPAGFQVGRPSPDNLVSPSIGISAGATAWDIFNQFQDF